MPGSLYLLPNTLGNPDIEVCIPGHVRAIALRTRVFIVENLRNARRYLKSMDRNIVIDELTFHELNEHTPEADIAGFMKELQGGEDGAVLSEAGVPGVADPGAKVVTLAHSLGIRVIPLTGPSSILMALMASGLNGQQFRFHGYLPVKRPERIRKLKELEQGLRKGGETQLFIEAPYRNDGLLEDVLHHCSPEVKLCIAADITMESEFIRTQKISAWKGEKPALHKRPVIFLLG